MLPTACFLLLVLPPALRSLSLAAATAAHASPSSEVAPTLQPTQAIYEAGLGSPGQGSGISNYSCYMNPAAITLQAPPAAGHVLAFTEARWPSCNDFLCREGVCGRHDIALRRSSDAGRSFGPMQLVAQVDRDFGSPNASIFNIAPVEDARAGRL